MWLKCGKVLVINIFEMCGFANMRMREFNQILSLKIKGENLPNVFGFSFYFLSITIHICSLTFYSNEQGNDR